MKTNILNVLKRNLTDLVFPKACQNCGESFQTGLSNILCQPCFTAIPAYEDPLCHHCGISLPARAFEDAVQVRCKDCGEEEYFLDRVRAVGSYEGALRITHHGFKFEGMEHLGKDIANKMFESSIPSFWEGVEAIVPVPLSKERERQRGYNPSVIIAREISAVTHIPVKKLLKKIRSTRSQMSLTREERLKNPKNAYGLQENIPVPAKLVLVDDVFTTGATLEECAKVLKKAGAQWIGAIVFGRTQRY